MRPEVTIDSVAAGAYRIPTDAPEGDGTSAWSSTPMVLARVAGGGQEGLGWSYAGAAAKAMIEGDLAGEVVGADAFDVPAINEGMSRAVRNSGRRGVAAAAISAVDIALWDLKAKLLGVSLSRLLGRARTAVPVYGSGGFTTYDDARTRGQVEKWVGEWGIPRVKIKIGESWGTRAQRDLARVALVRSVAGADTELYVDANGGYARKQAIRMGRRLVDDHGVVWFEEPVSSDDLDGLREVRDACDADVAAGEYGWDLTYFEKMLAADAVDCLQIDVTRCGGYTVWLRASALAQARSMEVSAHCAPHLHVPVAASIPNFRHLEYFHDHHRIETMLFEGASAPSGGVLVPDAAAPGHGLALRASEAERYRQS